MRLLAEQQQRPTVQSDTNTTTSMFAQARLLWHASPHLAKGAQIWFPLPSMRLLLDEVLPAAGAHRAITAAVVEKLSLEWACCPPCLRLCLEHCSPFRQHVVRGQSAQALVGVVMLV